MKMNGNMPRFMLTAIKSGSGKTTITCGILRLLTRKGIKVSSFKAGPDYIDPMFHRMALGVETGNLDTYFTDDEVTRYLLKCRAEQSEVSVLEGVMGYYDGEGGGSLKGSSYHLAAVTRTPAILIVDAKGGAYTLIPAIKGIMAYRKDSNIRGVIFNRISKSFYERLKPLAEKEIGIPVVGYVPQSEELCLPSRHLGLVQPSELAGITKWADRVADLLEETLDLPLLMNIAKGVDGFICKKPAVPEFSAKKRIAVASDEAFSFYYAENRMLLEQMGAELVPFSPIHDVDIPKKCDALLLGGGYPENYAMELSKAVTMRQRIASLCVQGMPCIAECGGFLYLQDSLEGSDGEIYQMAGVLHGRGYRTKGLKRFGYVEVTSKKSGQAIRGHEFHHWDCTENGSDCVAVKPSDGTRYSCMFHTDTLFAGFLHFFYYSNPRMVWEFLEGIYEKN